MENTKVENSFTKWLDTFLDEKGIDQEEILEFEVKEEKQFMPVAVVVEFMANSGKDNQKKLKDQLVKIDFHNANVRDFLIYIGKFVATV